MPDTGFYGAAGPKAAKHIPKHMQIAVYGLGVD